MTNADKVTVQYDMVVAEKKKTRRLDNKAKETDASKDRYAAFTTNSPWMDMEEYSKRWSIETGYRMIENVRAKTSGCKGPPGSSVFCIY